MTHVRTARPSAGDLRPAPPSRPRLRPRAATAGLLALAAATVLTASAAPATADSGDCTFGQSTYKGKPWALQRVMLDELWRQSKGKGVRVAVIDTGVDVQNPQLRDAVDVASGKSFLKSKPIDGETTDDPDIGKATVDPVGHGTKVAGIIAARPGKGTGFVGLAPEATIIPIKQNDAEGNGTAQDLAHAVDYAVAKKADVINISEDTANAVAPEPALQQAVESAIDQGVVVVASAGNDGLGGNVKATYPASFKGVLAVAASDRNNERAPFSQSGDFVGVAAPGVDMVSTVPKSGQCSDDGTSFSAPYVAGVAALVKAKHPHWTPREIVAQIEQTAERSTAGYDRLVGWGVVDPVRALTEDDHTVETPVAHEGVTRAEAPAAAPLQLGETEAERTARLGTYVTVGTVVMVAALAGTGVAVRDARRRRQRVRGET